eukprot:CAMPEP_0197075368 /NCGR_PEP_ID=MMETSP1384-20130603/211577_1 /TAXON_ID=29189 /ORGANISM="Ammonia sp." /LENGTH=324 /DNA_ID=CAMNT_0042514213 /DNA_START=53 /DNA_END=1027 /DNA_ORIENTATION=-
MTATNCKTNSRALIIVCTVITAALCSASDYLCEETEECEGRSDLVGAYDNIKCLGIASCYAVEFGFSCDEEDCKIECKNTEACKEATLWFEAETAGDTTKEVICDGFGACHTAYIVVDMVDGFELKCIGSSACQSMIFSQQIASVQYFLQDVKFLCEGHSACKQLALAGSGVSGTEEFKCAGEHACEAAVSSHWNPSPGFALTCDGNRACLDMVMAVFIHADATNTELDEIKCDGNEACHGMAVLLYNYQAETAIIEELRCEGYAACKDLTLTAALGEWRIKKCICDDPSPYSCLCAAGLELCDEIEGVWNQDGTAAISCSTTT